MRVNKNTTYFIAQHGSLYDVFHVPNGGEEFTLWLPVVSVHVSSKQGTSVVADDDAIWVQTGNHFKDVLLSQHLKSLHHLLHRILTVNLQMFGHHLSYLMLRSDEVEESLENPAGVRLSWMHSGCYYYCFLLLVRHCKLLKYNPYKGYKIGQLFTLIGSDSE